MGLKKKKNGRDWLAGMAPQPPPPHHEFLSFLAKIKKKKFIGLEYFMSPQLRAFSRLHKDSTHLPFSNGYLNNQIQIPGLQKTKKKKIEYFSHDTIQRNKLINVS